MGELEKRLKEFYELQKNGNLSEVRNFLRHNSDIRGFLRERMEANLLEHAQVIEDMVKTVRNSLRLQELGVPKKTSLLMGREVANYLFNIETAASHYRMAVSRNVKPIAAGTMVNITGNFGLGESELMDGIDMYTTITSLPMEISFENPLLVNIMFARFGRNMDENDKRYVLLGIKSMENYL